MTRGEQFYMVQAENRNYGYRRNFYGVRIVGRITALIGTLVMSCWRRPRAAPENRPVRGPGKRCQNPRQAG